MLLIVTRQYPLGAYSFVLYLLTLMLIISYYRLTVIILKFVASPCFASKQFPNIPFCFVFSQMVILHSRVWAITIHYLTVMLRFGDITIVLVLIYSIVKFDSI